MEDWLTSTTAADLAVRNVVSFAPHMKLAHAAKVLLREAISGAPVVDNEGVCVGVLSVTDVLGAEEKVAAEQEKVASSSFWQSHLALPASVYEEQLAKVRDKLIPAADQPISRFMTRDLVSVREDSSLRTVISYMVDALVHRVLVLDDEDRLVGLISTIDVLAAALREGQLDRLTVKPR